MGEKSIMRREFIAGAAVAAGVVASGANAARHGHAEHPSGGDNELAKAAGHCVAAGNDCMSHCLAQFKTGRTELADCAALVEELTASCEALATLAAQGSKHLPAFAAAVARVCKDCEDECRKHESVHGACRRCAEACATCREHCDRVA